MSYKLISEVMRTAAWQMHPEVFDYYKDFILTQYRNPLIQTEWGEKRKPSYLLVFNPELVEPEERLIMTGNTHWYDEKYIGKDDQIINVIDLSGPITRGGAECSYGTIDLADRFSYADTKPSVVGHLVLINTPGGSASANDLNNLFENSKKPVVALIRGMNASKGVEIASHIPHVFAENDLAEIGSIGTFASLQGIRNGKEIDGVQHYTVYATRSTQKHFAYREAIEKGNLEPVQKEIDGVNETFISNVKKRWPKCSEERLTGEMYNASEVEGELHDGYKSYSEAIDYIFELAGVERKQKGVVTPVGIAPATDGGNGTQEEAAGTQEEAATPETGPTSHEINNEAAPATEVTEATDTDTNPQTNTSLMNNIERLEAIPGVGKIVVDESGKMQLTPEQASAIAADIASGQQARTSASTLTEVVANQRKAIEEMAEQTAAPIRQAPPAGNNAVEKTEQAETVLDGPFSAGGLDNIQKNREILKTVAEQWNLM